MSARRDSGTFAAAAVASGPAFSPGCPVSGEVETPLAEANDQLFCYVTSR
ncbi:hypothetical protein EYZ11_013131 [Aspergillus tanneri]|uniref:Uncharacterized protein n=1 Tax=Aspergillus tanneri TaxID=1220188 RepID=A0A4S3IYI3_9EURO|nr:hypothetical protein EYZ11_013131 [Aspergillus tanneri]